MINLLPTYKLREYEVPQTLAAEFGGLVFERVP